MIRYESNDNGKDFVEVKLDEESEDLAVDAGAHLQTATLSIMAEMYCKLKEKGVDKEDLLEAIHEIDIDDLDEMLEMRER